MDKLDIIFWIIGTGFGLVFSFLLIIWRKLSSMEDSLGNRISSGDESLGRRIASTEESLGRRIDKLDEKVTDIDRRLCRIEGAMTTKECCVLKDDRLSRKAE